MTDPLLRNSRSSAEAHDSRFTEPDEMLPADPLGLIRRLLRKDDRPAAILRHAFLEDTYGRLGWLERGKVARHWYMRVVLGGARHRLRQYSAWTVQHHAVPLIRQRRELLATSLRWQLTPKQYYRYQLYDGAHRENIAELIPRYLLKGWLYGYIHRGLGVARIAPLGNKLAFIDHCERKRLPHLPIVAVFVDGIVEWRTPVPPGDLFAKPLHDKGGKGASVWIAEDDRAVYHRLGKAKPKTLKKLVRQYQRLSDTVPYALMARAFNHSELCDIGLDTLITARLIVIRDEQGRPEVVAAGVRLPSHPLQAVDNGHAGGMFAPVDIDTGRLGSATTLDPGLSGYSSHHPYSGALIKGRLLPYWEDVVRLALHAHEAFEPRVIVGWDICITDDGPFLVEGNSKPGLDLVQQTHGPIGAHRIGELLAYHVTHRNEYRTRLGLPLPSTAVAGQHTTTLEETHP